MHADVIADAHLTEHEQGQLTTGGPDHWAIRRRRWNCRAFRTELRCFFRRCSWYR